MSNSNVESNNNYDYLTVYSLNNNNKLIIKYCDSTIRPQTLRKYTFYK